MGIKVKTIQKTDQRAWDQYVENHPRATLYHLSGWKNVIEKTYGHKTYYLMAIKNTQHQNTITQKQETGIKQRASRNLSGKIYSSNSRAYFNGTSIQKIVGTLPLVHLKHLLFGNSLVSIPFFDLGGILADNDKTEEALLSEAIQLGQRLKAHNIELRHITPLGSLDSHKFEQLTRNTQDATRNWVSQTRSHKVRMLYELPESSEILMKSFKSKLRSQIKKPLKEGLYPKVGGIELLEDFYKVFSINMRDLGSPVHSSKLMKNVLTEFSEKAKIVMVYKDKQPLAASLIIGFKDTLENPWASALREYSRLSPNMLLYWTMLEYACDNDYSYFDFGRSSPDEGTYKFKKQWGAEPITLHWHYISIKGKSADTETSEKSKFEKAINLWQKLPVSVTKIIGPMIRKHIEL